jgi:hypothetical protein
MLHELQVVGAGISLLAFVILIVEIMGSKALQSFAAFMLWAMLDSIATITSLIEGGNFWLPLANAFGSGIIAGLLMFKKQITWGRVESFTSVLVLICLFIWLMAGGKAAIVASSLAVLIASAPQMVDTYKKPAATPATAYLVFLAANLLSLFAGRSWTIEERFYQACSVLLTVVIVIFCGRRFLKQERG